MELISFILKEKDVIVCSGYSDFKWKDLSGVMIFAFSLDFLEETEQFLICERSVKLVFIMFFRM